MCSLQAASTNADGEWCGFYEIFILAELFHLESILIVEGYMVPYNSERTKELTGGDMSKETHAVRHYPVRYSGSRRSTDSMVEKVSFVYLSFEQFKTTWHGMSGLSRDASVILIYNNNNHFLSLRRMQDRENDPPGVAQFKQTFLHLINPPDLVETAAQQSSRLSKWLSAYHSKHADAIKAARDAIKAIRVVKEQERKQQAARNKVRCTLALLVLCSSLPALFLSCRLTALT